MKILRKHIAALSIFGTVTFGGVSAAAANADVDKLFELFQEICLAHPLQVTKSVAKLQKIEGVKIQSLGGAEENDALVLFDGKRRIYGGAMRENKTLQLCTVHIKPETRLKDALPAAVAKIQSVRGVSEQIQPQPKGRYKFRYKNMFLVVEEHKRRLHFLIGNR